MLTKNSTIGVGVLMRRAAAAPIKPAGRADRLRPLGTVHDPLTIAKRCLVKPVLAADLVSSLAAGDDGFFYFRLARRASDVCIELLTILSLKRFEAHRRLNIDV
jgi:hypothetical protein